MKRVYVIAVTAAAIGAIIGLGTSAWYFAWLAPEDVSTAKERKIAYWVAPMDPNYRRDQPGKSPMGMDLVPVYEGEDTDSASEEPALQINPAVVNNIGVRTELVGQTDLSKKIDTVGTVVADEEQQADVTVRSAGWVEKLVVENQGAAVKKGQVLFHMYSPALVAAQSEYLQAVDLKRDVLIRAASERLQALGMTRAQISRLRSAGQTSRLVEIYAPRSGVVTNIRVREGMYVQPADTLISLADLSTVWVLADIFESEAAWIAEGQKATMTLPAFPGESWAGTVDYVYPTATAENRTVSIRLRFPNSDGRLKPNMYANVAIKAAPERNVLTIPQSALIRSSSGDRVILSLGDGRFRPAQVKAGIESEDRIEIISGLRPGERIVTSSQFLIDSEASLDAALLRLTSSPQPSDVNPATPSTSQAQRRISGKGRIISVDPAKRRITLEHGPIPALKWPAMRMEFGLGENVSAVALKPGDRIQFDLRAIQGGYEILEVKPVPGKARSGDGK